ncbi:hypothetical protein JCM33374_g5393 [Metschnikowia sp. JCM 33374]|nr:hypothetical protein JCM33374_g5393 [Metschnikowia sp. JCM 33374]
MTDELSPQSVTLVIILKLYLSNDLPEGKYLLIFLSHYLEGFPFAGDNENLLNPTLLSLCHSITRICKKHEQKDMLHRFVETIQLSILVSVWKIESADQLFHIVNETYEFVASRLTISCNGPRKISQRSIIGRFSQKLAVSIKLLHFDEISLLYNNFCSYRQTTSELFKKLQGVEEKEKHLPSVIPSDFGLLLHSKEYVNRSNFKGNGSVCGDEIFYEKLNSNLELIGVPQLYKKDLMTTNLSITYMESLVENQIVLLQRYGTSTPQALRSVFKLMASSDVMCGNYNGPNQGELSSIHYLTYLEMLKSGDYRGSFDALHRYFDYMVSKGSRYFYHFALVSKASLHQYFGEYEKALDSIEEAISVARENKDNSTLTYILSWLFDFVRKNPSLWSNRTFSQIKNDSQLLDSLVRKSSSVSLSLAAISYRFESEYLMNSNACFGKYYESLFKSNYLSINDHMTSFIGACHATSDLWEFVGVPRLANLYTELGMTYSELHGTAFDILEFRFRARRYHNSIHGLEDQDFFSPDINDASHHRLSYYKFMFQSVEHSLRKGRIRLAAEILDSLPPYDELDQESRIERLRLVAVIESAQGNFAEALRAIDSHEISASNPTWPSRSHLVSFLKLSMVKSKILIQSGVPLKAFSIILQRMEISKISGFSPFLSEGCCSLVQVLTKSGSNLDAYKLALAMLPVAFCVGETSTISLAFYELAKICLLFLKQDESPSHVDRKELFKQCLNFLSMGISGFKRSGDLKGLSNCFELESQISRETFSSDDIHNTNLLADFSTHSQKGLEILKKRANEQSGHGYLKRMSK